MNTLRYLIAVMLVVAIPAAIAYWLMIHPFVRFWRRLGTGRAYGLICAAIAMVMARMFRLRGWLLASDLGTSWPLAALGAIFLALSAWLLFRLKKQLPVRVLVGLPELQAGQAEGGFISTGLYARLRHPRYLQMTLALLGYALIANYPAAYGMFLFWCGGIAVVALLEERELAERFGPEYGEYCRRVPRFIPRLGR